MKTRFIALAALLVAALLVAALPGAAFADAALAAALEQVSKDQIAAFNREDAAGTLAHAYSKSPAYDEAKTALTTLFADADAKAEQVSFKFIGHDDEFAVARVKVKVTAADAGFQSNTVDALMIFHIEDGKWKVWDSYLLGSQLPK